MRRKTFFQNFSAIYTTLFRIRIQQLKLMRIHADPDLKPWFQRRQLCLFTKEAEPLADANMFLK